MSILAHPFLQHAFLAGTAIAAACGLAGFFLVLRAQVFTGDALSHVAFTGALAALAAGIDLRLGLFVATIAVAVGLGILGTRGRADDVVIGNVFAWVLGIGVFFLTFYTTSRSSSNGTAGISVLFGSIFGLSSGQAVTTAAIGAGIAVVVVLISRPLLFASLDEAVAAARGVPVRALGIGFLAAVGATAAEATQAVGALLLLGLLAAPAATALLLTARPYRGLAISACLAVAEMWAGLGLAFAAPALPPSFAIIAVAAAAYLAVFAGSRLRRRTGSRAAAPATS
ncbi:MAG: metal ABC transporter permease [Actinobacteria bacterium]|nr:metal ABC transporter permease [Actinomycetota bacterium]MBO0785717.1 metal ABC transporter permease [Actinomycetota bacterium]MBO0816418.1 metal ABC transporter permease [Actinomycetota bacterium]